MNAHLFANYRDFVTRHKTCFINRRRLVLVLALCTLIFFNFEPISVSSKAAKKSTSNQKEKDGPLEKTSLVVRVGAIYYDDASKQYTDIDNILSWLARRDRQSNTTPDRRELAFKLAVGTYDEVLEWYKTDQIDLAIMNPGLVALMLERYCNVLDRAFVGIRRRKPPETSLAASISGTASREDYHSILLLNASAARQEFGPKTPTYDEVLKRIKLKAEQNAVKFLFVHPFSTSGYIFPRALLQREKVSLAPEDYELTYSHDVSVKTVKNSGYDEQHRLNVAFVSDETASTEKDPTLVSIRTDTRKEKIVQDALFLTPDFMQREAGEVDRVKKLLRSKSRKSDEMFDLTTPDDWKARYEQVRSWISEFSGRQPLMSNALTIDQIIRRISTYNLHNKKKPARLAVVLSGGGAKCAYQLGAVQVIEDALKKGQEKAARDIGNEVKSDTDKLAASDINKDPIDLVVGTSGGAINALIVAAGVTRDTERRGKLKRTWMDFGQSEILRPSNFFRRLGGATAGFLVSFSLAYVCFLVRRRTRGAREQVKRMPWFEKAGIALLVASLIVFIIGRSGLNITTFDLSVQTLLRYHVWIHVIEYAQQGLRWMALAMFICGFLLSVAALPWSRSYLSRHAAAIEQRRWLIIVAVILMASLLPLLLVYSALRLQQNLFISEGIEMKMGKEIPALLNPELPSGHSSEALQNLSRHIVRGNLIKRNLIITGSMLPEPTPEPSPQPEGVDAHHREETDLYFFYRVDEAPKLGDKILKDSRFVDLRDRDNESILLDAVIGSGAIFPVFEPRQIPSLKRITDIDSLRSVSIIDGGFIHNSPIDAAVQFEATHIIVIEASPEDRPSQRQDFLTNSTTAFNYLFTQAQLLDAQSRRQAEIFTLRPTGETPYLCTMDFGSKFIEHAMERGTDDAQRRNSPSFRRQPRPAALD